MGPLAGGGDDDANEPFSGFMLCAQVADAVKDAGALLPVRMDRAS